MRIILTLLLCSSFFTAVSQDSLRFVSATKGGGCYQVEQYGNFLFAGTGSTFRVYDVNASPPFNMLYEHRFRSVILDFKIKNGYLYIAANHDGISKWDITNPASPVLKYEYTPDSLDEAAHDIAFYGDSLFVAYYKKVCLFFDNGTSFVKLYTFGHITGNGYISGGDLKGNLYAYTVGRNTYSGPAPDGIYFRNASTLQAISFFPQTFAAPEDVIFGKNTQLLHVLGGTQSTYNPFDARGYFYSLDVSNPSSPFAVYRDTLTDCVPGLAIAGPLNAVNINDTIYVATNAALEINWTFPNPAYGHVYIYKATTPSVSLIESVYGGLWHFDVDKSGNRLYVASEWYGVKTLDITNISAETDLGNTLTGGWCMKGDKYGNTMALANEGYGIKKYDISNIQQPVLTGVATFVSDSVGFCQEVKFSSGGAYIFGLFQTVYQFRVYDAATMNRIGYIANIGGVSYGNSDMLVYGNRVFIDANGSSTDSLKVIDVSVPSSPVIAASYQMDVNDMKLENGKIFTTNNNGIYVYDVTSGLPVLVASHNFSLGLYDGKQLAVLNDTLYAYVTWKGLVRYYYNSSNQTITELSSFLHPNGIPQGMAADAYGLYVAWTKYGLYSFNKQTLAQTSWYRTGLDLKGYMDIWPVTDLYCKDNFIFLNEYFGQATILTNDNGFIVGASESGVPPGMVLYPNPFSEETILFTGNDDPAGIRLRFYDLQGRELRFDHTQTASGFVIQRGNAAPGVYFIDTGEGKKLKMIAW